MTSPIAPLALAVLLMQGQSVLEPDSLAGLPLEALSKVRVRVVSLVDERVTEAPGIVSIVSRRELELFPSEDLAGALDRVAGVGRVTNFFQRNVISVRADALSTSSSHVLVLLDGRPIRENQIGGANADLFHAFPVELLERIEVIRGPGSVVHGSGAYSGVVNLVTREPEATETSFGASGGSFRSVTSWASAGKRLREGAARVGIRYHNSDGWPQAYRDVLGNTRAVSLDEAGGAVNAAAAWRGLTSEVLWLVDRGEMFSPAPNFPQGLRRTSRLFADAGFRHGLGGAVTSESHATLTQFRSAGYNYRAGTESRSDVESHSEDGVLEETLTLAPGASWDLVVGGLLNRRSGEGASGANIPAWAETWWSGYASLRARPSPRLHLSMGGQVIRANASRVTTVPRLGAVWSIGSGWGAKALYGGAYRSPAALETDVNLPGFLVGNRDLDAETVGTTDLELFVMKPAWSLSLAFYRSRQEGLIFPDASTTPGTFRNSGGFDSHGLELVARLAPSNRWYVLGSLALQTSTFNDSLDDVTPFPNGIARVGVGGTLSPGMTFSLFDTWYGRPSDVAVVRPGRQIANPMPAARHWLEASVRADLERLTGSPAARGLELFVRGENLLDEDAWAPEYAQRAINSIPATAGAAVQAGFTLTWNRR